MCELKTNKNYGTLYASKKIFFTTYKWFQRSQKKLGKSVELKHCITTSKKRGRLNYG